MQPSELLMIARYFGNGSAMSTVRAVACVVPKVAAAARAAATSSSKDLSDAQLIDHFFRDGSDKKTGEGPHSSDH